MEFIVNYDHPTRHADRPCSGRPGLSSIQTVFFSMMSGQNENLPKLSFERCILFARLLLQHKLSFASNQSVIFLYSRQEMILTGNVRDVTECASTFEKCFKNSFVFMLLGKAMKPVSYSLFNATDALA